MRFPWKAYADMVSREKESNDTQQVAKKGAAEPDASESAIDDVEHIDESDEEEQDDEDASS